VNNNPTEDVTVKILRNDLQKETKKKYKIYIVECEARSRAGRRKIQLKLSPEAITLQV
jgi:hypothetical protein